MFFAMPGRQVTRLAGGALALESVSLFGNVFSFIMGVLLCFIGFCQIYMDLCFCL